MAETAAEPAQSRILSESRGCIRVDSLKQVMKAQASWKEFVALAVSGSGELSGLLNHVKSQDAIDGLLMKDLLLKRPSGKPGGGLLMVANRLCGWTTSQKSPGSRLL